MQKFLRDEKLEGFLVLTKINRQYLSGFTGSAGVVLIYHPHLTPPPGRERKSRAELYVDDRYLIRARGESPLPVYPLTGLSATLSRAGRGVGVRVGIEDRITLREAARLELEYPKCNWVATQDVIEIMRSVKSSQEIRQIKKGSEIIDATFRHIVKMLRRYFNNAPQPPLKIRGGKGELSEIDIAQEIERMGKKLGADDLAFDPIVAWGPNAAAPHHFSSSQKIRRGNFLLLDFGFLVKGYHSDFTRTVFIGNPDAKQVKIYNTVLEAQMRAINRAKVGAKSSDIDSTARNFISKSGFGKYFTHNTGHGVGLEIHELPNFSSKSEDVLAEKMIVTVEPGIYIERWGGVRIEDMVVVKDRPVALSKVAKDFKNMLIN